MFEKSKLNLLHILLFVSLIHRIRGELKDLEEEIAGMVSENNDGTTVIKVTNSVDQILNKKFKSYELSIKEMKAAEAEEDKFTRITRDIDPVLLYSKHFETRFILTPTITTISPFATSVVDCYYCSASSASTIHDPCYEGAL